MRKPEKEWRIRESKDWNTNGDLIRHEYHIERCVTDIEGYKSWHTKLSLGKRSAEIICDRLHRILDRNIGERTQ